MKLFATISVSLLLITPAAFAKVDVFACEPEWKSLVETLGGEFVTVYSATTAFQDPHHIEARPSLIAKTRQADLLVCTGADLEIGWLPLLLRQSGNAVIQENELGFFLAASQVERIEVPTELDRSQGDVHAAGNPHVHWDPYRLITIAEALGKRLQAIDPENSTHYGERMARFVADWQTSITRWEQQADVLRGKRVIVYHKNWSYLLKWLQVDVVGDLEPKPGIPPTSAHLANLLSEMRSNKPDIILMANYQNDKGAQWLSEKTNVPVLRLPFTVGGSEQASNLDALYNEVLSTLVNMQ
ncbi:MAG: zinc/manganese transport system substrate-binding protein [Candidatus Endobugula sp.]|jgi:zinc/manganese transport system substrate-binding protein